VVPLDRQADFDTTRGFAKDIASILTARYPDFLTTEQRLNSRRGRLFLDVQRNAYGQTGVAPFTVRTQPECPVAAPLEWQELFDSNTDIHARSFTIANILDRLEQMGDPWQGMTRRARSLRGPRKKLNQLMKNQS
jgi:bifunctional non-homologous end joining protein LigD